MINFCSGLPGQHHKQIMINDAAYRSLFPEFGKCCSLPHSLHAEYGKYCRFPLFCCWNLFQNDNALSALFTQSPKNQNCLLYYSLLPELGKLCTFRKTIRNLLTIIALHRGENVKFYSKPYSDVLQYRLKHNAKCNLDMNLSSIRIFLYCLIHSVLHVYM